MKSFSQDLFNQVLKVADVECEWGDEYVIADDTIADNFYFRYDFNGKKITDHGSYILTEEQIQAAIEKMAEAYEEREPKTEENLYPEDPYLERGVRPEMFI